MEGIGRLAGGIAHDFNNLLTAIRGSASLALAELPPGQGPREDLEQIEQAADRAAGLTRQLLAFARRTVLQPEVIDLGAIVRRIEPMLGRLIGEDLVLTTVVPDGARCVLADPGQMEQVIVNLAVNARDAMPDGGTLTIEISDAEEAAVEPGQAGHGGPMTTMSVADTGLGMDADTLAHVFEPFFTTKGPGKGTGLGLATVYGIVRQSGGTMTARSEPGHGSIFTVYLPVVEGDGSATAPEPPIATAASRGRSGTILVVEDDAGVRRFASRVLERAGYRVLVASDGAEALAVSTREAVSLLLTDVIMPGMSGRDVAGKMALAQPGIRVLYMSGHTDKDIVVHGVLETGLRYMGKPFTSVQLIAAVDEALAAGSGD
jgi:two-component system cell cycle sensor histidine kinase/response regulator CckA